jgi:hypothetical protein
MFHWYPYLTLAEWIRRRKQEVMYLVVGPDGLLKEHWAELAKVPIDERFQTTVEGMVTAYIEKGQMPPAEIAPAIFNLADDAMAGRPLAIRAGDYVSLRSYMRGKSM